MERQLPLKFLKLGGALITDKSRPRSLEAEVLHGVCGAVSRALAGGGFRLLVGHGGGSFGHTVARDFGVIDGLGAGRGWEGFHRTRDEMIDMNRAVCAALRGRGIEAAPIQPSSFCTAADGAVATLEASPISCLLRSGATPVLFGDAVPDSKRGFTILSTETLFQALAPLLKPAAIVVLSDVPGILASPESGEVLPEMSRLRLEEFRAGGTKGADVTGGIASKARLLLAIAEANPGAEVRLLSGLDYEAVEGALRGGTAAGTLFRAG